MLAQHGSWLEELSTAERPAPLTVVTNWQAGLK